MHGLARALSSVKDERYKHCFLAKIIYARKKGELLNFKTERQKSRRLDKITVTAEDGGEITARLTAAIMFGGDKDKASFEIPPDAVKWRSFTAAEIFAFSKAVNDMNEIHLNEKPIVQGMMIFEYLRCDFGDSSMTVKFISPARADEMIYIKKQDRLLEGYAAGKKIFSAEYEE